PDARDLAAMRRHVARAAARFPRVVVTMHMGAEGVNAQRTRDRRETFLGEDRGNLVAFARAAVDAGADLVIGHGPHVLRAAEWRGRAFIAYSLGNLLTYGPFSMDEPLNRGAVLCAVLEPDGAVSDVVLRATVQVPPGLVAPDPSGRGAWLVDSLSRLDFPETGVRFVGEARAVEVPRK
ncbi:MAG: CapA family protein, partial [Gemmatimonadales bacterium]